LARGERSSPERTREDRERARAERERRRAERAGEPVPQEPPALESDPDAVPAHVEPQAPESEAAAAAHIEPFHDDSDQHGAAPPGPEASLPGDLDPEALPIAPPEPADPPQLPVQPTTAPDLLEAEPGHAPADPPEAAAPPPVEFEPETAVEAEAYPVESEAYPPAAAAAPEEQEAGARPEPEAHPADAGPAMQALHQAPEAYLAQPEPEMQVAQPELDAQAAQPEPEPAALDRDVHPGEPEPALYGADSHPGDSGPEPDTARYAAEPEISDAAEQDPYAVSLPPEPDPSAPEPDHPAAGEPAPVLDSAEAEPDLGHDPAGVQARPGYAIPGLPEPEGPEPRPALPEPPRRVRAAQPAPMRRAFRRVEDGSAGAGLTGEGRAAGGGRGRRSRWIAILALLAIGIVVGVLLYSLKHSSSSHPTAKATAEVKVLIPEGKTRLQIAQIASAAGLTGSYRLAARSSPLLNPAQYGAPKRTKTLEGFLFPATYDMDKGAPSQRLVDEQVTAFQENFSAEYATRAKALGLTPYELLTVASLIEREAQVPSDRAKIAAVIYNRLKAGIPIGIDAAIYYAVENADNIPTYTKELTASQLQMNSAYNTRLHKGLPPTPISNPGVASIQAAAHPAHASYLYYVAGADGCGEQVFSTTEAKFNEDVAAYEAAKRANGGHLPACTHH
jgi:cell division protein YceG involved in septum cleavage